MKEKFKHFKSMFFKGTATGLVLDNEFVTNETSLDLNNAGMRIAGGSIEIIMMLLIYIY